MPNMLFKEQEVLEEKDNLKILLEAGQIINSSLNIDEVLKLVMDKVIEILRAERGFIMLIDEKTSDLVLKTARNMDKQTIDSEEFSISLSTIRSVAETGKTVLSTNTSMDPQLKRRASIFLHSIRSILCIPLKFRDRIMGVVYVDNRVNQGHFSDKHRVLLEGLANQAAIAIENARLYEQLEKNYLDVIRALANAIEAKNPYTRGHSDRVTKFAVQTAKAMKLSLNEIKEIEMAGILHDVGKIGIGEDVLNKPGHLNKEEFEIMKRHPEIGYGIIGAIKNLPKVVKDSVLYHQEKYDGTGYPQGLKGEEIPLYARIIAVCDAFDAMTSDRVYRKSLGVEVATQELKKCSGKQFDPDIIDVFIECKVYELENNNSVIE